MTDALMPAFIIICTCGSIAAAAGAARVDPAETKEVKGERCRLSPDQPQRWAKGTALRQLQHMGPGRGVPANGAVDPKSVVVRHGDRVLAEGKDYLLDPVWGSLGIGPDSAVTSRDFVTVDYRYSLRRVDSVVRTAAGEALVRKGEHHLFSPEPPALQPGETRVANLFVDYFCDGTDAERFPVTATAAAAVTGTTPGRIPRTMAKIRAGQPVTIVCWGDSVTVGGDASDREKTRYAKVFERRVKEHFPETPFTVETVAVGGSNSRQWLYPETFDSGKNPRVKQCRWDLIEAAKPDLVTIEFVNDAGLSARERFEPVYNDILARLRKLGAEVILITPHFTMPDMMGFKGLREKEKRGYVLNLRRFAEEHGLALADASARWEHLWQEGIPYVTLLRNGINHPDDRGHALFADELMKCFAE